MVINQSSTNGDFDANSRTSDMRTLSLKSGFLYLADRIGYAYVLNVIL